MDRYRSRRFIYLTVSRINAALRDGVSRSIQPNVVNIDSARTTRCRAAFTPQANRELIHVPQVDALIGERL